MALVRQCSCCGLTDDGPTCRRVAIAYFVLYGERCHQCQEHVEMFLLHGWQRRSDYISLPGEQLPEVEEGTWP